jgi:hypothetical protein
VTPPDDPRVQFAGKVAARQPAGLFEAVELTGAPTAAWTANGVDAGGGVPAGRPVTLTLDRKQLPDIRRVELVLGSPAGPGPAHWRMLRDGRTVARESLDAGATDTATLTVPTCGSGDACAPFAWELRASGPGVLRIDAARLKR